MEITVEISYYPLTEDYQEPVREFIEEMGTDEKVALEPGTMSSLITGTYEEVMDLIGRKIKPFMEKYPSVFSLRISNACKACNHG